jgi:hypothetical protein
MKPALGEPNEHEGTPRELSAEELEAQAATELPEREVMTAMGPSALMPVQPGPVYSIMPVEHGDILPTPAPEPEEM